MLREGLIRSLERRISLKAFINSTCTIKDICVHAATHIAAGVNLSSVYAASNILLAKKKDTRRIFSHKLLAR